MIEEISKLDEIENLYKEGTNAPYRKVETGHGYYGVLIKDKASGKVQCHVCGKFFDFLSKHIQMKHKILSRDFKIEYGFPLYFPLCSLKISATSRDRINKRYLNKETLRNAILNIKRINKKSNVARKKIYTLNRNSLAFENERNICNDQVERRFTLIADKIGKTPNTADLRSNDDSLRKIIEIRYGGINKFLEKTGLGLVTRTAIRRDNDFILEKLREFSKVMKRVPRPRDFNNFKYDKSLTPFNCSTVYFHFGSWNRALHMAGFSVKERNREILGMKNEMMGVR